MTETATAKKVGKKYLIEIIGNVASGKTTLAKKLATHLNASYIDIDLFVNNPFLTKYVKNPQKYAFITGLHFSYSRAQQIPIIYKNLQKSSLVLDQGFDMGLYVYSKNCFVTGEMSKEEWQMLESLHHHLVKDAPEPEVCIFLDIPLPVIMERIAKRGRNHEKAYSKEYVSQLHKRLNEFKKDILKQRKSVILYSHKTNSFTVYGRQQDKLVQILQKIWDK